MLQSLDQQGQFFRAKQGRMEIPGGGQAGAGASHPLPIFGTAHCWLPSLPVSLHVFALDLLFHLTKRTDHSTVLSGYPRFCVSNSLCVSFLIQDNVLCISKVTGPQPVPFFTVLPVFQGTVYCSVPFSKSQVTTLSENGVWSQAAP